jgi:glycosyltransferase involved in cell wall biosynthesis
MCKKNRRNFLLRFPVPRAMLEQTKKMRVLFITDEMEVGGTQRQIVHIARSLDKTRFEATVVYFCNRSFLVDELESAGVRVIEIAKRKRLDIGFLRRLVAMLQTGGFDVVHCFAFTGELWGAIARRFLPRASRPALITSVRNKYDWYSLLQWRVKRWAALESSVVVANSVAGGEHARDKMQLPHGAVVVVYNGVADVSIGLPERDATVPNEVIKVLFVGRLVEQKNVPLLLRAMHLLFRKHGARDMPLRLLLAGDGLLRSALEQQAVSLGLDCCVEFLGERSDTPALMRASDFVVSPSFREGLSNVILEAMMIGRPVIASAVGGSVELVEAGETGILFESDNENQLAAAMQTLADDTQLREKLGATGRRRALERYTVQAMVSAMEKHYRESAASAGR